MPALAHIFLCTEIANSNFEFHVIRPFFLSSFSYWFFSCFVSYGKSINQSNISEIGPQLNMFIQKSLYKPQRPVAFTHWGMQVCIMQITVCILVKLSTMVLVPVTDCFPQSWFSLQLDLGLMHHQIFTKNLEDADSFNGIALTVQVQSMSWGSLFVVIFCQLQELQEILAKLSLILILDGFVTSSNGRCGHFLQTVFMRIKWETPDHQPLVSSSNSMEELCMSSHMVLQE